MALCECWQKHWQMEHWQPAIGAAMTHLFSPWHSIIQVHLCDSASLCLPLIFKFHSCVLSSGRLPLEIQHNGSDREASLQVRKMKPPQVAGQLPWLWLAEIGSCCL